MGQKRITEKDFWICDTGNVPAQFQSTQTTTFKKSGEKYVTVKDTSTSSWIDFGCKKMMLIYAIIAAAVVVIAAMTVATGGAALIALGALAGLAGAAWGAVVGALLCGQLAAKTRKWVEVPKAHLTAIQGAKQVTGDFTMTCAVGGTIHFAPQIKSWSQAISLGAANYIGGLLEGMMAGAAIGMGGAAISGGAGAFATGGIRGVGQAALQFAKSVPKNFYVNALESVGKWGLALRGVMGVQNTAATYGNTGQASATDFAKGTVAMETGAYHSATNIAEGKGTWQDFAGMALMFSPVGKGKQELENGLGNKADEAGANKADEADTNKADDETAPKADAAEAEAPQKKGDGEAYEDGQSADPVSEFKVGDEIASKPIVQIKPGTNGKVAIIGRRMAGHVEEVGANLEGQGKDVELFNEKYQKDTLFDIDGETYTWDEVSADFGDKSKYVRNEKGWIVDSDLHNTLMYKANKVWADKLGSQGYSVVDMGYPPDVNTNSVFYDMELNTIFGE